MFGRRAPTLIECSHFRSQAAQEPLELRGRQTLHIFRITPALAAGY